MSRSGVLRRLHNHNTEESIVNQEPQQVVLKEHRMGCAGGVYDKRKHSHRGFERYPTAENYVAERIYVEKYMLNVVSPKTTRKSS